MIQYTESLHGLIDDIVTRIPMLSFIDTSKLMVFARSGKAHAAGALATCHCLSLPATEPGYYFWSDRGTGTVTKRSEWFVTKSPQVQIEGQSIHYLISVTLPRFCDQSLARSRKSIWYPGAEPWIAKLDTIVHELYHIDPSGAGIRQMESADGTYSANCHGARFFEHVVDMVQAYLASNPDPKTYEFLKYTHHELTARHGGVAGTAFKGFPSYPARYTEVLDPQPPAPSEVSCGIRPLRLPRVLTTYTEDDLTTRQFLPETSRRVGDRRRIEQRTVGRATGERRQSERRGVESGDGRCVDNGEGVPA